MFYKLGLSILRYKKTIQKYMKKYLLAFFLIIPLSLLGQNSKFIHWFEGQVTLENKEKIDGIIQYDYTSDIVKVKRNEHIRSFTAKQCLMLEFFDENRNMRREYFSLPYAIKQSNYEVPVFFEVIIFGEKMTLLARQSIGVITERAFPAGGFGFYHPFGSVYSREVEFEAFYILKSNNKIKKLTDDSYLPYHNSKFKGVNKKLFNELFKDREAEIKSFIKKNKLNTSKRSDLIKIVKYYNTL